MGFIRDIKRVLALLPPKRQNLLFSATFSDEIKALADSLLNQPAHDRSRAPQLDRRHRSRRRSTRSTATRSSRLLAHLIKRHNWRQVLVFTRTKHGANKLAEQLGQGRHQRAGDPRQQEPGGAHAGAGRVQGRHACRCWSPPTSPRAASTSTSCRTSSTTICRTCRKTTCTASAAPAAPAPPARPSRWCASTSTTCCKDIEKLIKRSLPQEVIAGFEPDPNARPQPIQLRSGAPGHGGRGRSGGGQVIKVGAGRSTAKPRSAGGGGGSGGGRPAAPHRSGGRGR